MAKYKLTEIGVYDTELEKDIPDNVENRYWKAYLLWAESNTADPIDTLSLSEIKSNAKKEIDETAEIVRLKFITGGAGQAMAYQEKGEEAADYVAASYPADLSSYPFIQAEINATGKTKEQAADDIIAQKSAWITAGAAIEEERLKGKKAITDAADETAVNSQRDIATAALEAL